MKFDWLVAQALFIAMAAFWVAIWCLDMLYYNRLLSGAVDALYKIEAKMKPGEKFDGHIRMSSLIKEEFGRPVWSLKWLDYMGVVLFYLIVFAAILAGVYFSWWMR